MSSSMSASIILQIAFSNARAAECRDRARNAFSPAIAREFESFAREYERDALELEAKLPAWRRTG